MILKTFETVGLIFGYSLLTVVLLSVLISLIINGLGKWRVSIFYKFLVTLESLMLFFAVCYGFMIIVG